MIALLIVFLGFLCLIFEIVTVVSDPELLIIAVAVCLVLYIIYRACMRTFFTPKKNLPTFIYKDWKDIVVNSELETEIEEYILDPESRERLYEEIKRVYAKMPWHSEGDERLPLTANEIDDDAYSADEKKLIAEENRKEFKRILMAVQGHLPREDVEKGVVFHERQESNKDFRTLPSQMPTPVNNAKFMLWLKEELKSHSMDAPLYVEQAGKIYLAEDFPEMTGKFIWGWTNKDVTRKCKSCGEITSKFKCPACGQWDGEENFKSPKEAWQPDRIKIKESLEESQAVMSITILIVGAALALAAYYFASWLGLV